MRTLYNLLTHVVGFHLKLIALFNHKLKLGVKGRNQTFHKLQTDISQDDRMLWFHCASLGEYEQGLPVFEEIKNDYPEHKIVLSFFSPSGYEIRKNSKVADVVVYLPLDTKNNARRFVEMIRPELVVFVKYEIWPNYLLELSSRNIKTILISALFRADQTYFKSTGKWILKTLASFDHIFVQNEASKKILEEHGITKVTVSGDTRFDRVSRQLEQDNNFDFMEDFLHNKPCVIGGSTWPEDHKLFANYINSNRAKAKFIIAPHNIKTEEIERFRQNLSLKSILYSELKNDENIKDFDVLIIDTIGILSKLYSYGSLAYVGGAMGTTGLHNTLEAAVFGIPIIIGPHYEKFPEAHAMIKRGGMVSINDQNEFNKVLNEFISDGKKRTEAGSLNAEYIKENRGAVIQIMDYIRK